jgi:hypothetical protein
MREKIHLKFIIYNLKLSFWYSENCILKKCHAEFISASQIDPETSSG